LKAEFAAELRDYARESSADRSRPTASGKPTRNLALLRTEAVNVCRVLYLHPELRRILEYYAQSADMGTRLARRLISDAVAATAEFGANLYVSEDMIWRYPPLIVLAVTELHLDDIDGFPEFAVDLGQVLSQDRLGNVMTILGFATLILG